MILINFKRKQNILTQTNKVNTTQKQLTLIKSFLKIMSLVKITVMKQKMQLLFSMTEKNQV